MAIGEEGWLLGKKGGYWGRRVAIGDRWLLEKGGHWVGGDPSTLTREASVC